MKKILWRVGVLSLLFYSYTNHTSGPSKNNKPSSKSGGTLWAWGSYINKCFGVGANSLISPLQLDARPIWEKVFAQNGHNFAIDYQQLLHACGDNTNGELGNATTTKIKTLTPIQNGLWKQISSGYNYTMGITQDGSLWAWGNNYFGQLGNNGSDPSSVPVVIEPGTVWKQVSSNAASSSASSFAIKENGSLWAWGQNDDHQLGLGHADTTRIPTPIQAGRKWKQVSAGFTHVLAIREDGSLWAWGANDWKQLGLGKVNKKQITPVQVGFDRDWEEVSAGGSFSCAVKKDGSLYAWGALLVGFLPSGDPIATKLAHSPKRIPGLTCKKISTAWNHILVIDHEGQLWAWGNNKQGQLGIGSTESQKEPQKVMPGNICKEISAGAGYSMAIFE